MAYFATPSAFFSTVTGLLSLTTTNRTVMAWVRNRSAVGGEYNTTYAGLDVIGGGDSEGGLFTNGVNGTNPELYLQRPLGFFSDTLVTPVPAGTWYHATWVKEGTGHRFLINGVLAIDEFNFDLAGAPTPAVTNVEVIGNDGFTTEMSNFDVLYFRAWNTSLTDDEVGIEMNAKSAVKTASLWRDTPLTANGSDISGHGRNWTTNGTITYPPDTPFPDSADPSSAVNLGTIPVAYSAVLGESSLFNLWYKFTTPASIAVAGVFVLGDLTNYKPAFQLYTGSPGSLTLYWDETFIAGDPKNKPTQCYVAPATTYYLKVLTNFPVTYTGAAISISILKGPNFNVPAGSIFIIDDFQLQPPNGQYPHPAVFLSGTTGDVINFGPQLPSPKGFASGLGGDILPNGVMLFQDDPNNQVIFYNADFTPGPVLAYHPDVFIRSNPVTNKFYVSVGGASGAIKVVNASGAQIASYAFATGGLEIQCLAPANDDASLYYGFFGFSNSAIKHIGLPGLGALADLAPNAAGWHLTSLLVVSDGTILALYHRNDGLDAYVNRYSAAGAQLQTYFLGPTIEGFGEPVLGSDDTQGTGIDVNFWALTHHTDNYHRLRQIRLSDGAVLKTFSQPEFEEGVYSATATATPAVRYGPPGSCPFVVLRANNGFLGPGGPAGGGGGGGSSPGGSQIYPIRRTRILPHQSDRQLRQFWSRLEVVLESGMGLTTGQGSDPQIMFQYSDDGGHTWSRELMASAGKIGEFTRRAFYLMLGAPRDRVCSISVSDPSKWSLIDVIVDMEQEDG